MRLFVSDFSWPNFVINGLAGHSQLNLGNRHFKRSFADRFVSLVYSMSISATQTHLTSLWSNTSKLQTFSCLFDFLYIIAHWPPNFFLSNLWFCVHHSPPNFFWGTLWISVHQYPPNFFHVSQIMCTQVPSENPKLLSGSLWFFVHLSPPNFFYVYLILCTLVPTKFFWSLFDFVYTSAHQTFLWIFWIF